MKDTIRELERRIEQEAEKYIGMPIALSGGIDSSLLAALIKPKFAITVELPGGEKYNEIGYAKRVCKYLRIKHIVVKSDDSKWSEYMPKAVRAIGRPIPHFNIFPLYEMYKKLNELGERELVLGDGPDETMAGYARDLIFNYLYGVYKFEAFENYRPLIDKILPPMEDAIERVIGHRYPSVMAANLDIMRKDMDDMSNGIAASFGITNHRPYQDNEGLDNFMRDLPIEAKIKDVEFGKYALRAILAKYVPEEIAWRKKKVGGPVYPVNKMRGWMDHGEFDKRKFLEYQLKILNGEN